MNDPRKEFRQRLWTVLKTAPSEQPQTRTAQKKKHLWDILEHAEGRVGRIFGKLVFVFIILSLAILPIEFVPALKKYHFFAEIIEITVTAFFTVEYILRIYSAPSRWRYILSGWGIIDLLSVLPYYVSLASFQSEAFRLVRIIRIIRIMKIAHMKSSESLQEFAREKSKQRFELMQDEKIEKVVMSHPIFLVLGLILPIIFGGASLMVMLIANFHQVAVTVGAVFALLALILIYKTILDYHYDVIYITNFRIILQNEHLFGRSQNSVEYRDITNILPEKEGLLALLFGYGSLVIETSSDLSVIRHDHIRAHEKLACEIQEKCISQKKSQGRASHPSYD